MLFRVAFSNEISPKVRPIKACLWYKVNVKGLSELSRFLGFLVLSGVAFVLKFLVKTLIKLESTTSSCFNLIINFYL